MVMIITLSAILAIVFGMIILIWPKALNLAVALWLILSGVLQLVGGYYPGLSPF